MDLHGGALLPVSMDLRLVPINCIGGALGGTKLVLSPPFVTLYCTVPESIEIEISLFPGLLCGPSVNEGGSWSGMDS